MVFLYSCYQVVSHVTIYFTVITGAVYSQGTKMGGGGRSLLLIGSRVNTSNTGKPEDLDPFAEHTPLNW